MPLFPSSILSSFLRAFRAGDGGRVVDASLPGMCKAECGMPSAEWENGADGMARRKDETTTGRKVEPRSPSERGARPAVLRACRPVVDGPEPGAGFPARRPVDAIDRIDEVGRRVLCTMQNAQCTMEEGAGGRRAGAGGAAAAHTPKRASLPATEKEIDRVHAGDAVFGGGRSRVERDDGLRVVVAQALPPLDESAVYCRNRWMSRGFCISLQIRVEPLSPSAPGNVFHGKFGIRFEICRKLYPLVNHVSNEIFQAPDAAARRPAKPEPLAATPQLPLSA